MSLIELPICKICRDEDRKEQFLSPCNCKGSIGYVHKDCLLLWAQFRIQTGRSIKNCELCGSTLRIKWISKSIWNWKWRIPLTTEEKTKLNVFVFSYVVAAMDIARYFFEPIMKSKSRTDKIIKMILFAITSVSWIYIFSQHGKFFYSLWRRCKEQNMHFAIE